MAKDEPLRVYNRREVDDGDDIADLLAAGSARAGAAATERERGFAGTKLTGGGGSSSAAAAAGGAGGAGSGNARPAAADEG